MPEVAPALVELVFLALVFFTIALAFAAAKLIEALLGPLIRALQSVPLIGGKLAAPLEATARAVENACGVIVSKCEALVGASFHVLARLFDWSLRLMESQALGLVHLGRLIGEHVYSITGLRALVHRLEKVWQGIEHGVKTLTKDVHGLEHRVRVLEREVANGIGEDVLPRIRSLDRELHTLTTQTIPAVEGEARAAEADVSALGQYIAGHYVSDAALVTEAVAASVLTAAGVGWLRCNSNPFNSNKGACGMWTDLADLLGLALALEAAFDFDTLVHLCQDVAADTTTAIQDVFGLNAPPTSGGL